PRGGLLHGREADQSLAVWQVRARTGVLYDRRLAAGEIAHRSVAHPGVLEHHAGRLGGAELTARALHVGAITVRVPGDVARVPHAPAVLDQTSTVRRIRVGLLAARLPVGMAIGQVQGELERLARASRQLQELEKGNALRVVDEDALTVLVHLQPAGRGPARDGREGLGPGIMRERPEVQTD